MLNMELYISTHLGLKIQRSVVFLCGIYELRLEKRDILAYANSKGSDKAVHPCSLA